MSGICLFSAVMEKEQAPMLRHFCCSGIDNEVGDWGIWALTIFLSIFCFFEGFGTRKFLFVCLFEGLGLGQYLFAISLFSQYLFVCLFERLVARQKSLPSSCSSQY